MYKKLLLLLFVGSSVLAVKNNRTGGRSSGGDVPRPVVFRRKDGGGKFTFIVPGEMMVALEKEETQKKEKTLKKFSCPDLGPCAKDCAIGCCSCALVMAPIILLPLLYQKDKID